MKLAYPPRRNLGKEIRQTLIYAGSVVKIYNNKRVSTKNRGKKRVLTRSSKRIRKIIVWLLSLNHTSTRSPVPHQYGNAGRKCGGTESVSGELDDHQVTVARVSSPG